MINLNQFNEKRIPDRGIFYPLICNPDDDIFTLKNSEMPNWQKNSFLVKVEKEYVIPGAFGLKIDYFKKLAYEAFIFLKSEFSLSKYDLIDFKFDFGWNSDEGLVLTGVIDTESFRVYPRATNINENQKQFFYKKSFETLKDRWRRESSILESVKRFVH